MAGISILKNFRSGSFATFAKKNMTNRRRITIVVFSICIGTLMSAGLFYKRGNGTLDNNSLLNLATNMFFSLVIVIAIGVYFAWNKDKK